MLNIWVLAAVYDVCMHILMEQIKPYLEGEAFSTTAWDESGHFYTALIFEGSVLSGVVFEPYDCRVSVMESCFGGGVTVFLYSMDDYPLVLHNQGDEYEEVYRALYH